MKLGVYVDTTVFSAAEDHRVRERQLQSIQFFEHGEEFSLLTSELTRAELSRTPDPDRREKLLKRLGDVALIEISSEMNELADRYVEAGIIPEPFRDDAVQVAAAVISGQDVLVSWNFRHLVNRRRRSLINLLNASRNLPTLEIITPPEL